jgi:hypothetical protein
LGETGPVATEQAIPGTNQEIATSATEIPRFFLVASSKVADLLERSPEITAQRVFEELRQAGFDGGRESR